jgi:hypothetical protein
VKRFRIQDLGLGAEFFQHESLEAEMTVNSSVKIISRTGSAVDLNRDQVPDGVSKPLLKANTEGCLESDVEQFDAAHTVVHR